MSAITAKIVELYGEDLKGITIACNGATAPAQKLLLSLFDMGATLLVADREPHRVTGLTRQLYERSGSKYRYKPLHFDNIESERCHVFIQLEKPNKELKYAQHIIEVAKSQTASDSVPAAS